MIDPLLFAHSPAAKQWERIGVKHHHGVALPLFSLHSAESFGIGEFPDLFPVIDWCKSSGLDVIQLLPLNDTGWDTSPYNSLSAFALNPIHLGLSRLPYLEHDPMLQHELKTIPKRPHSLRIDYTHTREIKMRFLHHYFEKAGHQIQKREDYHHFIEKSTWLKGYALFKTLKARHQFAPWESWPASLQTLTQKDYSNLCQLYQKEIEWYEFLQFLCDLQLHQVNQYALQQHILLMGDIPILISRDSADVWLHRSLFEMNLSAGAPPDMFSADGQNWGFPIYNWEELSKQGYQWWIDRLQYASRYYHLYRLDHVVGFFRIWAVPPGKSGKEGYFIPSDPSLWIDQGQRILLTMLSHCDMLPIGEDLGVIPPEVRECLKALGICGTKVMRWERVWREDGRFIPPQDYGLTSMTTVSTHDSETLQLWWRNNPFDAKTFTHFKGWSYNPVLNREHQREILWDSHHSESLFHINLLQEYLALIPGLTWPQLEDERINVPGSLSENNWSYRFKSSIEELSSNTALRHLIQELII
jgi:4-alpha-glucanotransferase